MKDRTLGRLLGGGDLGCEFLAHGLHVLYLDGHEFDLEGHGVGIHLTSDLYRGGYVHVVCRYVRHGGFEVGHVEYYDRAGAVFVCLYGVDEDGVAVPSEKGEYLYPSHGLLEAIHPVDAHILNRLGYPEAYRVVRHYGAAKPYDRYATVENHVYGDYFSV
ncbi:hypothetical protein MMALV_13690 [Candidatus Methanomethylophilus alvi Mx1201]|uniref:Uncharacterized protein n=1 Tax=Methanomethylophilus alvi (strain Mx1201) TaxID=1236689 RepID=M9SCS8_METAX|nr:hypothetical protein MMALV_13690 [Candidatus Methanomethylophilus alvi Mx1201]